MVLGEAPTGEGIMNLRGYKCPVCDWLISMIEITSIKSIDPVCIGCGTRKWSEFVPFIIDDTSEEKA